MVWSTNTEVIQVIPIIKNATDGLMLAAGEDQYTIHYKNIIRNFVYIRINETLISQGCGTLHHIMTHPTYNYLLI